jgi:ubiquinone/menaquinone biosynthesis C-methylase UbiE
MLRHVVSIAIAVLLMVVIVRQCRKPTWWPGRLFLKIMNTSHVPVTTWGLSHVQVAKDATMLDVGCGGGKTIETLATMAPSGTVFGIDYSAASVAASRRHNASGIGQGRIDIRQGSVSSLPFSAGTFDLVTAVETHYYWPNLSADVREVLRVLKPGGRFALIAETYRGRTDDWLYRPAMKLLGATYLDVGEHRALLTEAGFSDVGVFEERARGWICAVGTKA